MNNKQYVRMMALIAIAGFAGGGGFCQAFQE